MLPAVRFYTYSKRFEEAYTTVMRPLTVELKMAQPAVDILLFLANNPGCETAGAICRMRGLKPAIVSFHIDRLVNEGFLLRQSVPGDRRKTALVLTEKAESVVERGRGLQKAFADRLIDGLSEEDLAHFRRCVAAFDRNIERIRTENSKGTEIQNP